MNYSNVQVTKRKIQLAVLVGTQRDNTPDFEKLKTLTRKYLDYSLGELSRGELYTNTQLAQFKDNAYREVSKQIPATFDDDTKEQHILSLADGIVEQFCDQTSICPKEMWEKLAYLQFVVESPTY